jgi:uncharacterized protein (DUF2267 family)
MDAEINTAKDWLKDMTAELHFEDEMQTYRSARAVLQTVRDRLPVNEAVDFGSQLPIVLGGLYYHDWKPAHKPEKFDKKDEFYSKVNERLSDSDINPEHATNGVLKTLEKRITTGEIKDVIGNFPKDLAALFPKENS